MPGLRGLPGLSGGPRLPGFYGSQRRRDDPKPKHDHDCTCNPSGPCECGPCPRCKEAKRDG